MSDVSRSSYTSKANIYDGQLTPQWVADVGDPEEKRKIERLLQVTGPLSGLRILEPGCGNGRLTAVLAEQTGPTGCIVAMDISQQKVAAARQRLSGYRNVMVYLGPAEVRARSMGRFDQIICHQVFPYCADPSRALQTFSEILNPFGLIVMAQLNFFTQGSDLYSNNGATVPQEKPADADKLRRLCGKYGFKVENWHDDRDGYLLSARLI